MKIPGKNGKNSPNKTSAGSPIDNKKPKGKVVSPIDERTLTPSGVRGAHFGSKSQTLDQAQKEKSKKRIKTADVSAAEAKKARADIDKEAEEKKLAKEKQEQENRAKLIKNAQIAKERQAAAT